MPFRMNRLRKVGKNFLGNNQKTADAPDPGRILSVQKALYDRSKNENVSKVFHSPFLNVG
jgi:hypothetical protein